MTLNFSKSAKKSQRVMPKKVKGIFKVSSSYIEDSALIKISTQAFNFLRNSIQNFAKNLMPKEVKRSYSSNANKLERGTSSKTSFIMQQLKLSSLSNHQVIIKSSKKKKSTNHFLRKSIFPKNKSSK